jgi:putative phosphoribosyl transferase
MFRDRSDAGNRLGEALAELRLPRPWVFALPRGGVPVAEQVASKLGCPWSVISVRKIGHPRQPELALGAVAKLRAPVFVRNDDVVRMYRISERQFEDLKAKALIEVERRAQKYQIAPPPGLSGATAIVVDDGLATGATARAAIQALRHEKTLGVILAVPVASQEAAAELRRDVDRLVALETPAVFPGVGALYDHFEQLTDDVVLAALARSPSARSG